LELGPCPANEAKVVASLAAFQKLDERAKQCRYCETLATLSVILLYGSYGMKVACIDARAIEPMES
jgi:hypothetical protein